MEVWLDHIIAYLEEPGMREHSFLRRLSKEDPSIILELAERMKKLAKETRDVSELIARVAKKNGRKKVIKTPIS